MNTNDRRADDPRLTTIIIDVAELKKQMAENTEVTKQVHDILASFRVMAAIAKWVAAIGAGCAAIFHGAEFLHHTVSAPPHK